MPLSAFLDRTVRAYYSVQAGTRVAVVADVVRLWRQVRPSDVDASWAAVRGPVGRSVAAGQVRAATAPQLLVDRVLADDGLRPDPLDTVSPLAFAGYTADGVDLTTVLDTAPVGFKVAKLRGLSDEQALAAAERRLALISGNEVADAGRGAMDAAIRLEPQIVGYERHVNLPCCSRCLVLAGKFYSKSAGFLRHPGCDCTHTPLTSRKDMSAENPRALFDSMTDEQQDAAFTRDGARAIRDGASIGQVVNARYQGNARGRSAGMSRPGDPYTTAGTTKRSAYYRQQKAAGNVNRRGRLTVQRLSPQGVALRAGDDTVLYRRLLRENGYIV